MNKCTNRGFSLVELLIGMAIMVLILAGLAECCQQDCKVCNSFVNGDRVGPWT